MYETALAMAPTSRRARITRSRAERHTRLTAQGKQKLTAAAETLPGVFRGTRRREELATQALVATQVFSRDIHYVVRDDKVQIVDELTGRILPDRSWEQGLHQMVEAKEGCALTSQQTSVARITYQRFFRRYLRLAGMTGTAHEIAPELWSIYRLPVVKVPTNRPVKRRGLGQTVFATTAEKWRASWNGCASSTGPGSPCSSARARSARPRS